MDNNTVETQKKDEPIDLIKTLTGKKFVVVFIMLIGGLFGFILGSRNSDYVSDENGRYQAVVVPHDRYIVSPEFPLREDKLYIVDTKKGTHRQAY